MGQCAPTEPAKAEDDKFAARNFAMRAGEFAPDRLGQCDNRGFGEVAIRFRNDDRVAVCGQQLHTQRKAAFANHPANPVQRHVERLCSDHRQKSLREIGGVGRNCKARFIDQPVEQCRSPGELIGKRGCVREDQRKLFGQSGPRAEQPVKIDPA